VTKSVEAARIKDPIVVNSTPRRDHLHFFVTDPGSSWFTRCGEGNAVYDADVDTVFIDRSLFLPTELTRIGQALHWERAAAPRQFPFSRTFLTLITLHELGHRTLHRVSGGFFDSGQKAPRNKELEADGFALEALKRAYAEGILGDDSAVLAELAEAGLGRDLATGPRLTGALFICRVADEGRASLLPRVAFLAL